MYSGASLGAGGVGRRVVLCAARRPVRVVHGLSVLFSSIILSLILPAFSLSLKFARLWLSVVIHL